ncbi:MAG TPA: hypothetical protein VFA26_04870 [Gemmataceae bacterium]|nr:hypothetical protein [Gemmataceae bacterium]
MVVIKFADVETQDEAIGFLAYHFSVYLYRSGEVIVPETALGALAYEGFSFTVLGKATHAQQETALRGDVAGGVQRRKTGPQKVVRKRASGSR